MGEIYVGAEDCIELENGDKVYILQDLSQGADDDLWAFDRAQGGAGDAIWIAKLLELAIVRIVHPDGGEEKPTYEDVRLMKGSVTAQLREAVMSRWYPLGWAALKALAEEESETETTSGEPSTGSKDSAKPPQNGSSASTSLERCTGISGPTGQRLSGLLTTLKGLWPRRR